MALARPPEAAVFVNGWPDLAAALGALGVQLGAGDLAQRSGDDEDHGTTATFTATTGGNPLSSSCQLSPSSADAKSLPVRVPK